MDFINNHKKTICTVLSTAMILGTSTFVLADEEQSNVVVTDTTTDTDVQPTAEPTATPDATATPSSKDIDLDITGTVYTTDEKNVYKVTFRTEDILPQITGFSFTAAFSNATINSVTFGDTFLSSGTTSKSITDDTSVKLIWKDGTAVGGSNVLAGIYIYSTSTPNDDSITIEEFTALGSDGTEYTITPTLNLVKGVNMPDLSDEEQEVYDLIKALPTLDELSFYDTANSDTLVNLSLKYTEAINTAIKKYTALTSTKQKNVETALSIDGRSYSDVEALQKAVDAMQEVYGILELKNCYEDLEEETALNYQYVYETYTNLSTSAPSKLKTAPKAANEYSDALSEIEQYNKIIETKIASVSDSTYENYQIRIASLKTQLDFAKSYSEITLAKALLSAITQIANNLTEDIEDNYTGSYKSYMISDIEKILEDINSGDLIYKNLPTAEIPDEVRVGSSWTTTITRKKALIDQQAEIKLLFYNESGTLIKTVSGDFNSSKTSTSINFTIKSNESKGNENLTIKCYYVYNDVSYLIKTQTTKVNPQRSTNSGASTGSTTTSGGSGNSGTIYPTTDTSDATPTKAPSTANINPYSDIDNYDWAMDAIIGLTNAGIVNGMGDDEFNPAGNVTREQFCKMVVQLFGVAVNDTDTDFKDVDPNAWYAPYISAAVQAGYVQGQSSDYFGVGEVIMRQDMATILYRATGFSGDEAELTFTDRENIAAYAEDAVAELVGLGVMNGYSDGSFKPRGSATRAEAAKVIWGIHEIL